MHINQFTLWSQSMKCLSNIAISDFHNDINSDLVNLLNEKGSSLMPTSGFFNKIMYMLMSYIMESLTDNNIEFFTTNRNHEIKMTDGCPCCLSNVRDALHMCSAIQASDEKCIVVVSTSFEKEFDVKSFEERFISGSNITIYQTTPNSYFILCELLPPVARTLIN